MLKELAGLNTSHTTDNTSHADRVINEGVSLYQERYERKYPTLGEMFEGNQKEQFIGASTAIVMRNQEEYIENFKRRYGESTYVTSLGDLAPKVIDVVRIFYPNMIANLVAEIQPLSTLNGQVLTVKPIFSNTAAGVQKGQEVFVNETNSEYASDYSTESIATTDGAVTTFAATLSIRPVRPGTVSVRLSNSEVATDDGKGNVSGDGLTGTVNYSTGAFSVTFTTAPTTGQQVTVTYRYDFEVSPDNLREMEIAINLVPVTAKPHPLRINWSVAAELAASAAYNLDVEDTVSNLAAQFIRKERDGVVVDQIRRAATANTNLDFNAGNVTEGITRKQHFQDWSLKLTYAESLIFSTNGRGTVSFVLGGINATDVISHQASFVPEPKVIPIGAHKLGTLGGTVDVIKDNRLPANEYVFGFRGMQVGDAALILADFIPIYFTPTFQNSNLNNSQGLLSMYDTLLNNNNYYFKGTIEGYSA